MRDSNRFRLASGDAADITLVKPNRNQNERFVLTKMRALGLPDFETVELTASRQQTTISRLARYGIDETLAHSLEKCDASGCDRQECSAQCWFALRNLRLNLIPYATKSLFASGAASYTVAAIHPAYQRELGDLAAVNVDGYQRWIDRRFRRLSRKVGHVIAFGSIEVTLNTDLDGNSHWSPHVQLVVAGAEPHVLRAAFQPSQKAGPSETLVMVKPCLCLGRALAYALKRKPDQRVAYIAKNGRTHRRKIRMFGEAFREHEAWLASQSIYARLIMHGLKWQIPASEILRRG